MLIHCKYCSTSHWSFGYKHWQNLFLLKFYSNWRGLCKKDVTPLLTHWSYVFLALTHLISISKFSPYSHIEGPLCPVVAGYHADTWHDPVSARRHSQSRCTEVVAGLRTGWLWLGPGTPGDRVYLMQMIFLSCLCIYTKITQKDHLHIHEFHVEFIKELCKF